jgi:hypothetical protein
VQPRLNRFKKLPEMQHHTLRFGSHRVVGRPQRCNQQDANEGANEDGGNPASRWAGPEP